MIRLTPEEPHVPLTDQLVRDHGFTSHVHFRLLAHYRLPVFASSDTATVSVGVPVAPKFPTSPFLLPGKDEPRAIVRFLGSFLQQLLRFWLCIQRSPCDLSGQIDLLGLQFLPFQIVPHISQCLEVERQALIQFKQGLSDPGHRLSSWTGDDCCSWSGITCSNLITGHVIKLNLRIPLQKLVGPDTYKALGVKIKEGEYGFQYWQVSSSLFT
ncbi:hypothetical protein J5N97_028762 [Dioscorea zingiberensis]|uniref:Leucine-rich repeat-containing N-terminal plant-type domain-containing protein n=1 Tax=Dioscorea zingiberensis TaxID=325984 RepID=A0A9D5BZR0_9LILI|nr:hypothetical protein J5N97_028762 [Dioscorea zingiberensis]